MIDTSVLVAGISGFKPTQAPTNPSAELLRAWLEGPTFLWLITENNSAEYKDVRRRLGVRRNLIGESVSLLREEAELVDVWITSNLSPDPGDNAFSTCAEQGVLLSLRLSTGRTSL